MRDSLFYDVDYFYIITHSLLICIFVLRWLLGSSFFAIIPTNTNRAIQLQEEGHIKIFKESSAHHPWKNVQNIMKKVQKTSSMLAFYDETIYGCNCAAILLSCSLLLIASYHRLKPMVSFHRRIEAKQLSVFVFFLISTGIMFSVVSPLHQH